MKSLELATSSNNMGLKCKDSMDSPCFAIKKGTPLSPLNQIINFLKKWGNASHDGLFTNFLRCKGKHYIWIYQKNHEENPQKRRGTSRMLWDASCFQGECILMVRDRLHLIYKYYDKKSKHGLCPGRWSVRRSLQKWCRHDSLTRMHIPLILQQMHSEALSLSIKISS